METSAVTGEQVDEVFIKCATAINSKIESGSIDTTTLMTHVHPGAKGSLDEGAKQQAGCSCSIL
jgi:hypothetical protein